MKQIEINGLLWDTENLEIDGKKYFRWKEAMDAAKSVGKRLPTKNELQALIDAGWEWDEEKKGMWMADRKLFSPLSGYLNYASGSLSSTGYGYLWSSSPKDASSSWHLNFTAGAAYMTSSIAANGFPVRCVQDIPQTGSCKVDDSGSIACDNHYASTKMSNEYSGCSTSVTQDIEVNLKKASTIQCDISVESIAKMQETIDDYRRKIEWICLRLMKPDENPPLILKWGIDSSNDVFECISRELNGIIEKLGRRFLVVKGRVIAPNIKCINYKDHPDGEMLPENEAIAFFPEEHIPKDAIIIEGDVFITKEMLIDGFTLLCTKEISAYAAFD